MEALFSYGIFNLFKLYIQSMYATVFNHMF